MDGQFQCTQKFADEFRSDFIDKFSEGGHNLLIFATGVSRLLKPLPFLTLFTETFWKGIVPLPSPAVCSSPFFILVLKRILDELKSETIENLFAGISASNSDQYHWIL